DGSKDENVFDIQQGVSINIFVKKNRKNKDLGEVFYSELFGQREFKYQTLTLNDIRSVQWNKVSSLVPDYFYVVKDFRLEKEYKDFLSIKEIFNINGSG